MELEKQVRKERAAFDKVETPRTEHMWNRIRKELRNPSEELHRQDTAAGTPEETNDWQLSIGRYWRWSIAAGVALVIGWSLFGHGDSNVKGSPPRLSDYYPELAAEEDRYQRLINQKEARLAIDQLENGQYEGLFEELALLEEIRRQHLKDLPHFFDNEQLVRTLLKYYEQKIRILERLSLEIEKKKHHEKRHRETPL